MNTSKQQAKLDLLESVGFLNLRLERSLKLINKNNLPAKYEQPIREIRDIMLKIEKDLRKEFDDKFWIERANAANWV